jgi:beta-1,4-mannosyltransferase
MKVVDMFGAGIPVLAVDYQCIGELVKNGENGYTFKNCDELYGRLVELS